jgi:hypothetical protein
MADKSKPVAKPQPKPTTHIAKPKAAPVEDALAAEWRGRGQSYNYQGEELEAFVVEQVARVKAAQGDG